MNVTTNPDLPTSYAHIWKLSWPIILSNMTLPLVGAVDVAMMGHLSQPAYIGAVGLGTLLFNFIYLGAGFLRMGTTGFTARAFGKGDDAERAGIIARALVIAVGIGVVGVASSALWLGVMLKLLSATEQTEDLMSLYVSIRVYELPASLINTALMGWFFGQQRMKTGMFHMMLVNLINVALNALFVLHLERDVDGVALASVLAQYAGLIYFCMIVWVDKHRLGLVKSGLTRAVFANKDRWMDFARMARDLGIRTFLIWAVEAVLLSHTATMGEFELASMQIILTLFAFIAYGLDGFAHAAEALVGMTLGAGRLSTLREVIWRSSVLSAVCACAFSGILFVAEVPILRLLTSQPPLIEMVMSHWLWVMLIPFSSFLAFQMDGVYIGASEGRVMRNTMVGAFAGCMGVIWLVSDWGLDGLLLAFILYLIARGVLLMLCLPVIYSAIPERSLADH